MTTLIPGRYVRHPARPDWGLGQIQSVVGPRVTVNFENVGKVLINTTNATLVDADDGTPHGAATTPSG